jgi:hypothetical protein
MAKLLGALLTLAKPVAPNELIEAVAEVTAS